MDLLERDRRPLCAVAADATLRQRAGDLIWRHQAVLSIAGGAALVVALAALRDPPMPWIAWDSRAYWAASLATDAYAHARVGEIGAYLYSPAFVQLIAPAGQLPWPAFVFGWAFIGIIAVAGLAGPAVQRRPWLWLPIASLAILDVGAGNINVLLGAAIAIGFRVPGAWAFVVLTKVTPGIGLLWFAVRGEWRALAMAFGVTALVVGISAVLDPWPWIDWLTVLLSNTSSGELQGDLAAPAVLRFPVAIAATAWGAWTGRRWVLPIAALLLLPVVWPNGLAILIGCAALTERIAPMRFAPARRWPLARLAGIRP